MDGRRRDHDLGHVQQWAQGAGRRVVQRIVGADPERAGLRRCGLVQSQSQARARMFELDRQPSATPPGRTKRIGGPPIWAFHPASEHRTKFATPISPATRRLAIDIDGKVTVYDTQDHQIREFSQQQLGSGSLSFSSQLGGVDLSRLPAVSGANGTKAIARTNA